MPRIRKNYRKSKKSSLVKDSHTQKSHVTSAATWMSAWFRRKQTLLTKKHARSTQVDTATSQKHILIGRLIAIAGLLLLVFPTAYRLIKTSPKSFPVIPTEETATTSAITNADYGPIKLDAGLLTLREPTQPPLRIVVPSRKVDLSITEARVINGYWELSETTASHGIGSANPGESGNVVVFAHARDTLFGPLRDLKAKELIYILTKDRWFRYQVEETKLVDPSSIETIAPTTKEQLTLFTCSGFLDTKRLILLAKPYTP